MNINNKMSKGLKELPPHLQAVSSEQAREARNTDLVQYLSSREELIRDSQHGHWRLKEHDSLIIKDSFYWWNSRGESGNAIDFMQSFYGMSFKEAVEELTNSSISYETKKRLASATNTTQVSAEFSLPTLSTNMRRTFAYLIKTRCIDTSIVQNLAKEKLLMQDEKGNAVFPWLDEKNQIVGAELCGTLTEKRFKGVVTNSAYGYGYNIRIGTPNRLFAFESAIDLLSFYTLYQDKLQDILLVSMAGLKIEVIEGFLQRSTSLTDVRLGVDNDKAGKQFVEALQAKINAFAMLPKEPFKDWNDYLKSKKAQA